jgi:hypothetical protein
MTSQQKADALKKYQELKSQGISEIFDRLDRIERLLIADLYGKHKEADRILQTIINDRECRSEQ